MQLRRLVELRTPIDSALPEILTHVFVIQSWHLLSLTFVLAAECSVIHTMKTSTFAEKNAYKDYTQLIYWYFLRCCQFANTACEKACKQQAVECLMNPAPLRETLLINFVSAQILHHWLLYFSAWFLFWNFEQIYLFKYSLLLFLLRTGWSKGRVGWREQGENGSGEEGRGWKWEKGAWEQGHLIGWDGEWRTSGN